MDFRLRGNERSKVLRRNYPQPFVRPKAGVWHLHKLRVTASCGRISREPRPRGGTARSPRGPPARELPPPVRMLVHRPRNVDLLTFAHDVVERDCDKARVCLRQVRGDCRESLAAPPLREALWIPTFAGTSGGG